MSLIMLQSFARNQIYMLLAEVLHFGQHSSFRSFVRQRPIGSNRRFCLQRKLTVILTRLNFKCICEYKFS